MYRCIGVGVGVAGVGARVPMKITFIAKSKGYIWFSCGIGVGQYIATAGIEARLTLASNC